MSTVSNGSMVTANVREPPTATSKQSSRFVLSVNDLGGGLVVRTTKTPATTVKLPAALVAVREKRTDSLGLTVIEPAKSTEPKPEIVTRSAFSTAYRMVALWPTSISSGTTENLRTRGNPSAAAAGGAIARSAAAMMTSRLIRSLLKKRA